MQHKEGVGARPCDADLSVALVLFWLVSIARVAGGVLRHEVFGAEATLALMAVVFLPWAALRRRRHCGA